MQLNVIALDQHGCVEHNLGKHPRKELLTRHYAKHIDRMYHDTPEGTKHIGYIVRGHWFRLYVGVENTP